MRAVMVKLSAVQLTSVPDVDANLDKITVLLSDITFSEQHVVVLPECCLYFGGEEHAQLTLAQQSSHSDYLRKKLAGIAKQFNIYLVAGSIPKVSNNQEKFTNTSCVFSPSGQLLADYQKIHLFDVELDDNTKNYYESSLTERGKNTSVVDLGPAQLGMSICYDLRFPELFRSLANQGANIIAVPSAFTVKTGQAHWQPLLQARAIENQCYIVAAGQVGTHANGRETWGHSMIISPWGDILATQSDGEGVITAEFNLDAVTQIRKSMPVQRHNQFTVELKN